MNTASFIDHVERTREETSARLEPDRRAQLGQFFTPAPVAGLIAKSLRPVAGRNLRILDPGAGVGSLAASTRGA